MVSCALDGTLIVYDTVVGLKTHRVRADSGWLMTCAYSPRPENDIVAAGDLKNNCTLYQLNDSGDGNRKCKLVGHMGFVSSIRFVDKQHVVTTSGDESAIMWDIESEKAMSQFFGHRGTVNSVAVSSDKNMILTAGSDKMVKLWDVRSKPSAIRTFIAHACDDVMCVSYFPTDTAFGKK
jgi:WD40 repeat protein